VKSKPVPTIPLESTTAISKPVTSRRKIAKTPSADPAKAKIAAIKSALRASKFEDASAASFAMISGLKELFKFASSLARISSRIEKILPLDEAINLYEQAKSNSLR
jgi:hypothetical protein